MRHCFRYLRLVLASEAGCTTRVTLSMGGAGEAFYAIGTAACPIHKVTAASSVVLKRRASQWVRTKTRYVTGPLFIAAAPRRA